MVAVSAHIRIEPVAFSHLSASQGVSPARANSNQNKRHNSKSKLVFSIIDFIIYGYCLSRCIVIVIIKPYRLLEHSNVIITPL